MQLVRYEEGQALADEFNVPFFETSAKEDVNVKEAFFTLAKLVKDRMPKTTDGTGELRKIDTIRLTVEKAKPEASSCSSC
jgi:Ras-related protein Rab-8A